MGMSASTYIGTYVLVKNALCEHVGSVRGCWNEKCEKYKSHNSADFCSECGSKIEKREFKYMSTDEYGVSELIDERLISAQDCGNIKGIGKDEFVLMPNHKMEHSIDVDELGSCIGGLPNKLASVSEFVEKYKKDIDRLEKRFPEAEFEIRFGMVRTYF